MSAPTPRTDAAWSASFEGKQLSAGQTAQALRDCSQQLERELATITVERDQLRAEVARLRAGIEVCLRTNAHLADGENCTLIDLKHCLRDSRVERAEAERADAIYQRACEVERDLRAQLHALQLVCGTNDANKFETWVDRANARAERAEAAETVALAQWNGALERAMKAEADLATERARLDYLLQWDVTFHDRADIDAELSYAQRKKSTPTLP